MNVSEQVSLSRFTTLGTGGPARVRTPETLDELVEALRTAREHELAVATVGLGSNLLAADEGVDALVLKLEGELARVAVDDARDRRRRRAQCRRLHRARAAELGGFEFACAIPERRAGASG